MAAPVSQPKSTPKFKCVKCGKDSFKTAQALATHREALNHHPVVCPKCSKEFASKVALKQHKVVHKPKPTPVQAELPATRAAVEAARSPVSQTNLVVATAVTRSTTKVAKSHTPQQRQTAALQQTQVISHLAIPPLGSNDNPQPGTRSTQQQLNHNGHSYTVLSPLEQDLLFKYLLARCHPPSRLRAQGYRPQLPNEHPDKGDNRPPPKQASIKPSEYHQSPQPSPTNRKRRAIVLDCEMVEVRGYQRELAFLSVVDFLTGDVLINQYVAPSAVKVTSWNTSVSGITPSAMARAIATNRALRGWRAARNALWQYVDTETVLVGHSLNSDLKVLGMLHDRVVDSAILTGEAVFITESTVPLRRTWALKKLTKLFLSMEIQNSKNGHNCLEDTLATRDVVIWCLRNPEHLKVWADMARAADKLEQEQREAKKRERMKEKEKKEKEKKANESKSTAPQTVDQSKPPLADLSDEEDFDTDISALLGLPDVGEDASPRGDPDDYFRDY